MTAGQDLGRARKAARLLVECLAHEIDAAHAEQMDRAGRGALAEMAGLTPPSPETWGIVVGDLQLLDARTEAVARLRERTS